MKIIKIQNREKNKKVIIKNQSDACVLKQRINKRNVLSKPKQGITNKNDVLWNEQGQQNQIYHEEPKWSIFNVKGEK